MKIKGKKVLKKSKKSSFSKFLTIAALVVAILGIASLANNIYLFTKTVNQYVAQGYPASVVVKQLLLAQLLPGVCEPIAVYGGIAVVLLAVKIINQKVLKCLELLTPAEVSDNINAETKEDSESFAESDTKQNPVSIDIDNEEKDKQLQASKA
ncbi:hypothetical protein [Clostridium sp. JN-1]|uniref:hypothetical protein n=1 Tax=Clostridium sp. JN-1 TaxID=2483110 RepID=UPI0016818C06|nr:hypothetical protein [Clostridium sp. JN-1]